MKTKLSPLNGESALTEITAGGGEPNRSAAGLGNRAGSEFPPGSGLAAPGIVRASLTQFARQKFQRGFLEVDLVVGLAILTLAIVPLGFSFARERQMLKVEYARSVATEIVDGEMEILAAGAAKDLPEGAQPYPVQARAAASLPPGQFQLTKTGPRLRLEWKSDNKHGIGVVARETALK